MQEISLNILDIAQNSLNAGATLITIDVDCTQGDVLCVKISDNGCGMDDEKLQKVTDPFFTSRTTRRVGLGVPFLKMAALQTGGSFNINSQVGVGTVVETAFHTAHIDCMPLGDIGETIIALITCNEQIDFVYTYKTPKGEICADTRVLREILDGVAFSHPSITAFLKEYIDITEL